MSSAVLDLDALLNTAEATVRLTHLDTGQNYTSFITQDMQISGGSNYSNPFEDHLQSKNDTLNKVTVALNTTGLFDIPQMQLKVRGNTIMLWQSSDRPTLSIPMTFLTLRESQSPSVTDQAIGLASMVYPEAPDSDMTTRLNPPGGYGLGRGAQASGVWMLEIGTWFRALDLVLTQAPLTLSQVRTKGNQPLYASVDCQLTPYRMISSQEFKDWFLS